MSLTLALKFLLKWPKGHLKKERRKEKGRERREKRTDICTTNWGDHHTHARRNSERLPTI